MEKGELGPLLFGSLMLPFIHFESVSDETKCKMTLNHYTADIIFTDEG